VRIETLLVEAADGVVLDADLGWPDDAPEGAAVVAHPHPLHGGTRHNPVVDALFVALVSAGFATIRFDFRGVGRSTGTHDHGHAERLDVAGALEVAVRHRGSGPLVCAGYSFGALVALNTVHPDLTAWVAVAPPLGLPELAIGSPLASNDRREKLLVVPEHDQFTGPDMVRALTRTWPNTVVETVAMADHFLAGRTSVVAGYTSDFVSSLVAR
jgi:hypothetical protein